MMTFKTADDQRMTIENLMMSEELTLASKRTLLNGRNQEVFKQIKKRRSESEMLEDAKYALRDIPDVMCYTAFENPHGICVFVIFTSPSGR